MRYAIVIEKLKSNYSVFVPDLPGCVATGATIGRDRTADKTSDRLSLRWFATGGLTHSRTNYSV